MRRKRRRIRKRWIAAGVLLIAMLLAGYQAGRWFETRSAKPETRGTYVQTITDGKTLEIDGATYQQRKNVKSILLMGVDRTTDQPDPTGFRNGGQADFLQLVVIDEDAKKITRVQIDRDTMTPITILGVLGHRAGMRNAQICLSHGFGDGKAQSCELTAEAVSNLLLGTPIDEYIAMNMDGIPVLNDSIGGVTVTLEDDFSALDPTMTQGTTLKLSGEQAELFVRSRRSIGVGTNEGRMKRQKQYIAEMTNQLDSRMKTEKAFIGELFDDLKDYLTTGMSRGLLINTVWNAREYERHFVELAGSYQVGSDGFMQFYADSAALQDTVLALFYQEVK